MKNDKNIKMQIHCYKHNGKIHRIWEESTILEETDELLVCGNYKTNVIENDGRSHKTKEPAIIFFYKNSWFNIIAQFKEFGLFYYCNIASPYIIDEDTIKYIDYDLDLRVFPDGGYRILDKNEYKYHKKIMNYSKELDIVIKKSLDNLIEDYINGEVYFNNYRNMKYSQLYNELNKMNREKTN